MLLKGKSQWRGEERSMEQEAGREVPTRGGFLCSDTKGALGGCGVNT